MRKAKYTNDVFGADITSPADDIINDAWDAETATKRVKLARKALAVDLNVIDAYNILGIHAETHAERIALFREATLIGQRLFEPVLNDKEMAWWGFMGTRPWMRAQHNLGLALMEAGDREEASAVFKYLLALNPNDNQGIRMLLLKLMAEAEDYGGCKILFAEYADESSIEFAVTRLLIDIATKRKIDFAKEFSAIEESNKYVLPMIMSAATAGKWPKPPKIDMVAWGSKQEAALYLNEFKAAWQCKPKLLRDFKEAFLGLRMREAVKAMKSKDTQ